MNSNHTKQVVTRFAPSPTGLLHLGNYRTALFSYLLAKQNDGKFLLRIEDTDRARYQPEFEANILESLAWLGLKYDNEGEPWRQSKRAEIYTKYIQKLLDENKAYISQEKVEKEGDRAEVIRFRNPNKKVKFTDMIRGEIETDTTDLGDFIIAKSLTEPIFHLVVVIDDFEMGITHVTRGEDHIPNTPRHILLQEAIGATTPVYAHLPLILSPDRSKLSKRKGAQPITYYRDQGYLPETLINYMALLGWNPGTDQEIFSLAELIKIFSLEKVQKSGAIFNPEKLNWLNKEYIKKLPAEKLEQEIAKYLSADTVTGFSTDIFKKIIPTIVDRISYFAEIQTMLDNGEIQYFFAAPTYDKALLKNQDHFTVLIEKLEAITGDFTKETTKGAVWDYATENGRGEVLWPMRVALSGREKSPDPFTIAEIIGKEEVLGRLRHAQSL